MATSLSKLFRRLGICSIILILAACSSNSILPESPEIKVRDVDIVELGFSSQKFLFNLDAFNPNNFDLPLNGVEFSLKLSDVEVGKGLSEQEVDLVSGGTTLVPVEVTTNLASSLENFKSLLLGGGLEMTYEMDGKLHIIGQSIGVPFNVSGNLME